MKSSTTHLVLIILMIQSIQCSFASSKSMVTEVYGIKRQDGAYVNHLMDNLKTSIMKQFNGLLDAMKSPKGFKSPNICVWKICSKPLKKLRSGVKLNKIDLKEVIQMIENWELVKKNVE